MQEQERYSELIAVKVSAELAESIKRAARNDRRTVSGYVRVKLADLMQREASAAADREHLAVATEAR